MNLENLFAGRKFKMFILGLLSSVLAQVLGVDPSGELTQNISQLTMAAVGAQGLADFKTGGTAQK